jgi:hypothetical protein
MSVKILAAKQEEEEEEEEEQQQQQNNDFSLGKGGCKIEEEEQPAAAQTNWKNKFEQIKLAVDAMSCTRKEEACIRSANRIFVSLSLLREEMALHEKNKCRSVVKISKT